MTVYSLFSSFLKSIAYDNTLGELGNSHWMYCL